MATLSSATGNLPAETWKQIARAMVLERESLNVRQRDQWTAWLDGFFDAVDSFGRGLDEIGWLNTLKGMRTMTGALSEIVRDEAVRYGEEVLGTGEEIWPPEAFWKEVERVEKASA